MAAKKSIVYNNSLITTFLESCGLPIHQIREGGQKTYSRTMEYDYCGNKIREFDSIGRFIGKNTYDKLDRCMLTWGMDSGESWRVKDVADNVFVRRNSRGISFRFRFNVLHQ